MLCGASWNELLLVGSLLALIVASSYVGAVGSFVGGLFESPGAKPRG